MLVCVQVTGLTELQPRPTSHAIPVMWRMRCTKGLHQTLLVLMVISITMHMVESRKQIMKVGGCANRELAVHPHNLHPTTRHARWDVHTDRWFVSVAQVMVLWGIDWVNTHTNESRVDNGYCPAARLWQQLKQMMHACTASTASHATSHEPMHLPMYHACGITVRLHIPVRRSLTATYNHGFEGSCEARFNYMSKSPS